jgi:hypothetical protein
MKVALSLLSPLQNRNIRTQRRTPAIRNQRLHPFFSSSSPQLQENEWRQWASKHRRADRKLINEGGTLPHCNCLCPEAGKFASPLISFFAAIANKLHCGDTPRVHATGEGPAEPLAWGSGQAGQSSWASLDHMG